MSPHKVRRHIRKLKRQRRREARELQRAERARQRADRNQQSTEEHAEEPAVHTDVPSEDATAQQAAEDAEKQQRRRPRRATLAAAALAGALGIGVIASAALPLGDSSEDSSPGVSAWSARAALSGVDLVCAPMPGRPDSLSDGGVLNYEDPDEDAETALRGLSGTAAAPLLPLGAEGAAEAVEVEGGFEQNGLNDVAALRVPRSGGAQDSDDVATDFASREFFAAEGAITGLALGGCDAPRGSHLFMGPSTGVSAVSLLTLTNPSDRPATAEVSTMGPDGEYGDSGTVTVLIPEESVRSVNISSLQSEAEPTAVAVEASGAPVAAHLQSSRVQSGEGAGSEILSGAGQAGTQHTMPAVLAGAEQDPQLWLYAPGTGAVNVELQVFSDEGQVGLETPGVFTIEAGEVHAVDLEGLEAGSYTVVAQTDVSAYAATRTAGDGASVSVVTEETDPVTGEVTEEESEEDPQRDFSWSASSSQLVPGSTAVLPALGEQLEYSVQLAVGSHGEDRDIASGSVEFSLVDSSGARGEETLTVDVPAAEATTVDNEMLEDLADANGWDLEDVLALSADSVSGAVHGAVLSRSQEGGFSISELSPPAGEAPEISVHINR